MLDGRVLTVRNSHLHGHKFQIVQRSTDYTSDDPALNPPINETQPNPVRRDTVEVPSGTGATLRVVADNPGAWIFHCTCAGQVYSPRIALTRRTLQATSNGISKSDSR